MYFKLPNIFDSGDTIHITGGFHGRLQNNTAMDFKPHNLIAPIDGCTITGVGGTGQLRFFNVKIPANGDVMLQCVHGVPTRGIGQVFRKGEVMGRTVPFIDTKGKRADHWHIAIRVNGVWQGVMTYIERIYKLQLHGSPWSNPYDQWSFYADRALMALPNQFPVAIPTAPADNEKPFTPPAIASDPAIEPDVTIEEPAQANPVEEFVEDAKNTEQELEKARELTDLQKELIDDLVSKLQKQEGFDPVKAVVGLFKTGTPQGIVNTILASVLALLADIQDDQKTLLLIGTWVTTLLIYGVRFVIDKLKK